MKQNQGIDKSLLDLIKEFEGYSEKSYVDPGTGDKPYTIGYGSTKWLNGLPVQLNQFINRELADKLLIRDITEVINDLKENCPNFNRFNKNQQNAIISFSQNTGWYYGKKDYDTLNKGAKTFDLDLICKALPLYINKGSKAENGLRYRRKKEVKLFNTPVV
jgi:lysozyme